MGELMGKILSDALKQSGLRKYLRMNWIEILEKWSLRWGVTYLKLLMLRKNLII
jgi:hypothetical protein